MKLLIIGNYHHKNEEGIIHILKYLNWQFKFGSVKDIPNANIVFSPGVPLPVHNFPNIKFIFGPHFSVFPNFKVQQINNIHHNCIYIQPSEWVIKHVGWKNIHIPIKSFCFPVNTNRFKPLENTNKNKVFIYYKRRNPQELELVKHFLNQKKIPFQIFDYIKKYDENHYLQYLQQSKFGIIVDAHESQGFAIEEALSCDVPLLVWNTKTMNQEYDSQYQATPCTTIPYWDERCGEYFYNANELEEIFNKFINKLNTYKPREYVLENLSLDICSQKLKDLIELI